MAGLNMFDYASSQVDLDNMNKGKTMRAALAAALIDGPEAAEARHNAWVATFQSRPQSWNRSIPRGDAVKTRSVDEPEAQSSRSGTTAKGQDLLQAEPSPSGLTCGVQVVKPVETGVVDDTDTPRIVNDINTFLSFVPQLRAKCTTSEQEELLSSLIESMELAKRYPPNEKEIEECVKMLEELPGWFPEDSEKN
ncbi:hypothetical protein K438DRAFT_1956055 [Mycena galopus ATCC 62051]|nr:hypothetical protein K438DRAFT_1956055 [Mycena galopus ATCC 62051]